MLHTYMQHWSRSWSVGVEKPDFADLSDPALIRLGAGYFEEGCAPCHGAPGRERNPLVKLMEPEPPDLAKRLHNYGTKQLYWIVWNGIRYTGMPGWTGDHRQDEVWAMVAFLEKYRDLDGKDYDRLAYGEIEPHGVPGGRMSFGGLAGRLDKAMQNCARCHGKDGMGRDGTAPKIAGQSQEYLLATLRGYASGKRSSGIMQPIAAPLSDDELKELASHIAGIRPTETGTATETASQTGAATAQDGGTRRRRGRRDAGRDAGRDAARQGPSGSDEPRRAPRREGRPVALRARRAARVTRTRAPCRRARSIRASPGRDPASSMPGCASIATVPTAERISPTSCTSPRCDLTDHQIEALAAWYSAQSPTAASRPARSARTLPSGSSRRAPATAKARVRTRARTRSGRAISAT